jgi:hypothetical protein
MSQELPNRSPTKDSLHLAHRDRMVVRRANPDESPLAAAHSIALALRAARRV